MNDRGNDLGETSGRRLLATQRARTLAWITSVAICGAGLTGVHAQEGEPARPPAPDLGTVGKVLQGEAAAPTAAAGAAPAQPAAASQTAEQRLAILRRKVLRDEDFVESEDNRDPFHSYLNLFEPTTVVKGPTVPAIFDKFALEELTLIAIISGTNLPMAMFRDPAGLGQVIKRGDYLSKSAARVTKILADRVVLELNEVVGTGEARAIEKAVLVNPEAAQQ